MKRKLYMALVISAIAIFMTGCGNPKPKVAAQEDFSTEVMENAGTAGTESLDTTESTEITDTEGTEVEYVRGMEGITQYDGIFLTGKTQVTFTSMIEETVPEDLYVILKSTDGTIGEVILLAEDAHAAVIDLPPDEYEIIDVYFPTVTAYDFSENIGRKIVVESEEVTCEIDADFNLRLDEFKPSEDWGTVMTDEYAVQIDDIILLADQTAGEVIEKIKHSSANYNVTNDVGNPLNIGALIGPGETYDIHVLRAGLDWFTIECVNNGVETVSLDAAPVTSYQFSSIAQNYTSYIGGLRYSEILKLKFSDFPYQNRFLDQCNVNEETGKHCTEETYQEGEETLLKLRYINCDENGAGIEYDFIFERETGCVIGFNIINLTGN